MRAVVERDLVVLLLVQAEPAAVDAVHEAFVEVDAHHFIIDAVFEAQQIGGVRQCLLLLDVSKGWTKVRNVESSFCKLQQT